MVCPPTRTTAGTFCARPAASPRSSAPTGTRCTSRRRPKPVSRINTHDFVKLLDNINLAGDLGAETVWLKSEDVAKTLLDFARENGITKIVLGRTHKPLWRRLLRGDVTKRLLSAATDFDIEVVGGDAEEPDKEP